MVPEKPAPLLSPSLSRFLGWSAIILLTTVAAFNFPLKPSADLDPSWRMALGYFYEHGLQFGRDVVFNYGPLGFIMGKTYSGLQFGSLIAGQLMLAVISALVIAYQASRLGGRSRVLFLILFLVFGVGYEDALHMLVIAILGFELVRRGGAAWRYSTVPIAVVLAIYAQIKFTDFLLTSFIVLLACGYGLCAKRRREAAFLALIYVAAFLCGWLLLGQKLGNLPAYFAASWQISDGYLWSMGFPAPFAPLWKGVAVLLVLIGYAVVHFLLNPDKPRAAANTLLLGAFVYLNWKHGFVRADGHMIGFFHCALLPLVAYPALLDDPPRFRRAHYWVFLLAAVLSLWAVENALWGALRGALGRTQDKIWSNVESVLNWQHTRQQYEESLAAARTGADLYLTREIVGQSTVDVVGFEIGVALLNDLNYRPRPVIQSYSTFSPPLEKLNYDLYASDRAPQYVLSKIQTIDRRLAAMDDSQVLLMLAYRYKYLRTEKGFGLWRLNPGPFDPAKYAPHFLRGTDLAIGEPLVIEPITTEPLWIKIDLQPSLLGRLRSFLYKPPQVTLHVETTKDEPRDFLMPLPQGRTGFIINPLIEDVVDFMHFANSQPLKRVRSIAIIIDPDQRKYFAPAARVELSTIPSPTSGQRYFASDIERLLHMFQSFPVSYTAHTPVSETTIDGREAAILHAPSRMIFEVPPGARLVTGKFGMMPGTYTDGGHTDGALFLVYWSNGADRIELFRRYLDPANNAADRGLQDFSGKLDGVSGGRLFLEIQPGPNNDPGWDWTAWSNIKIE